MQQQLWYKIYAFLLVMAITFPLSSQKIMDKYVQGTLNNYIEYTNDNIHALWGYHVIFRRFNNNIVRIHSKSVVDRATTNISYNHEDFAAKPESYYMLPSEQYIQVLRRSEYIESDYRYPLNDAIGAIDKIMGDLNTLSKEIAAYAKGNQHHTDQNLKKAYSLLERGQALFDAFQIQQQQVSQLINQAAQRYKAPNPDKDCTQHSEQLKLLTEPAREIMLAVKSGNSNEVRKSADFLRATIELVNEEEAEGMNRARIQGEVWWTKELQVRYDFVLSRSRKIYDAAQEYLQALEEGTDYPPHGPGYYFYNKKFTNLMNRYGRGIVLQYNKFVDESEVRLIKMTEEPHWFKVDYYDEDDPITLEEEKTPETPVIPAETVSPLEGYASNNLVFLLDVSRSMNTPEKLGLMKSSIKQLVDLMRPEDRVSIVKYSGDAKVVLEMTSSSERDSIYKAIDDLEAGGGSKIGSGLSLAFSVLQEAYTTGGNNKIILATDGAFETDRKLIKRITGNAKSDRLLSIFFFGKREEAKQKTQLIQMTRAGEGNYSHIKQDNLYETMLNEAKRIRSN